GSAPPARSARIVRVSRHDYSDSLLAVPELPEIETLLRGLGPDLRERAVTRVIVRERRLRGGVASDFAARLTGRRIRDLHRRGKYLLARLDDGRVWLLPLGLNGRLTPAKRGRAWKRADPVAVRLA